jgi:hypothetical protein
VCCLARCQVHLPHHRDEAQSRRSDSHKSSRRHNIDRYPDRVSRSRARIGHAYSNNQLSARLARVRSTVCRKSHRRCLTACWSGRRLEAESGTSWSWVDKSRTAIKRRVHKRRGRSIGTSRAPSDEDNPLRWRGRSHWKHPRGWNEGTVPGCQSRRQSAAAHPDYARSTSPPPFVTRCHHPRLPFAQECIHTPVVKIRPRRTLPPGGCQTNISASAAAWNRLGRRALY